MHLGIFDDPDFVAGNISTHFIEHWLRRRMLLSAEATMAAR
jgi:hypothetical protein